MFDKAKSALSAAAIRKSLLRRAPSTFSPEPSADYYIPIIRFAGSQPDLLVDRYFDKRFIGRERTGE